MKKSSDLDERTMIENEIYVRNLMPKNNETQIIENDENATGVENVFVIYDDEDHEGFNQLERPSTLSIVSGFFLTGVAIIGLMVYVYIFYRKCKKRRHKKRKDKETIVVPPATTSYISKNKWDLSANVPQGETLNSSQITSISRPLSPEESAYFEDISYCNELESSGNSLNECNSFARALQLAASLDEQTWDEFQQRKIALENDEIDRAFNAKISNKLGSYNNRNHQSSVPSMFTLDQGTSNEGMIEEYNTVINNLQRKNSTISELSFPYGDKTEEIDYIDTSTASNKTQSSKQYNLAPPTSSNFESEEENFGMVYSTNSFLQKIEDIEKFAVGEMREPRKQKSYLSRQSITMIDTDTDESMSTSDLVSEISDLSRYVRQYERRKDAKNKRDGFLHERCAKVKGVESCSSTINKFISIKMDGRVCHPHPTKDFTEDTKSLSSMTTPPSSSGSYT